MEPEYFLKPEEFHQLLKTTETSRDRLILLLLGGAGLRVGEMTQVRVEDFDLDAGCLRIRSEVARGGKGHTAILPEPVIAELVHYLADNAIDRGYLFPGRTSGHMSSRRVQIALNALAERANLQITKYVDKGGRNRHRITPHLLRHSFAAWSLESGIPIHDLKEQLGHVTLMATTVYVQDTTGQFGESYLQSGFASKHLPAGNKIPEEVR